MTIESEQQRIKQIKKYRDEMIRREHERGASQKAIAYKYGISQGHVSYIIKRGRE